jgi:hypothetical protein
MFLGLTLMVTIAQTQFHTHPLSPQVTNKNPTMQIFFKIYIPKLHLLIELRGIKNQPCRVLSKKLFKISYR